MAHLSPTRLLGQPWLLPLLLAFLLIFGTLYSALAQVGIGTTTPDAKAALDVSSTTRGFLPPRMTQVQRDAIASPPAGLVIYNTTTNRLNTWNGTVWTEAVSATAPGTAPGPTTFTYTGAPQMYTVPADVVTLQVDVVGAQGGGPGGSGPSGSSGRGGRVQASLSVTPGQVLHIYVGGQGGSTATSAGSSPAGWNGGGLGWNAAGGGGGASDVRVGGTTFAHRVVVAGGGGGQHFNDPYGNPPGGNGGGLVGANGQGAFSAGRGGSGGSQTSGGQINGALGQGGDGNNPGPGFWGGGGGGGGYYGG
ncbi:MAG TPA: glycine-rich protein, partial [bacterium]|nr:glycine-rich protein [bacterium]